MIATVLLAVASLGLYACGGGDDTRAPQTEARSHFEGGEESVERFGSEATGSEREAVLAAEQAYLSAIASKDFAEACSFLSASLTRSFEQLATPRLKAKGCSVILSKLLAPTASAISHEQAEGRIAKVRVKGDQAFVIFHAPGARLYVFTMLREQGGWKASTLAASILVPETSLGVAP